MFSRSIAFWSSNDKEALISFMGNEINALWFTREEMENQDLNDMIADFLDNS